MVLGSGCSWVQGCAAVAGLAACVSQQAHSEGLAACSALRPAQASRMESTSVPGALRPAGSTGQLRSGWPSATWPAAAACTAKSHPLCPWPPLLAQAASRCLRPRSACCGTSPTAGRRREGWRSRVSGLRQPVHAGLSLGHSGAWCMVWHAPRLQADCRSALTLACRQGHDADLAAARASRRSRQPASV